MHVSLHQVTNHTMPPRHLNVHLGRSSCMTDTVYVHNNPTALTQYALCGGASYYELHPACGDTM